MICRNLPTLFFITLLSFFFSRASEYQITNLTNADGLSNSSVNKIVQTSNKLLWLGTWDGLNIYNGRDFKVFQPQLHNLASISSNVIRDIIEEDENTYWISTDFGINRFDFNTKQFERFFVDSHQPFDENSFVIAKNSQNSVFTSVSNQGIFYFDREKQQFQLLSKTKNLHLKKIFFDFNDHLWCYTHDKKMFRITFDSQNRKVLVKTIVEFDKLNDIDNVFYDNGVIWLQNSDKQIFMYDLHQGLLSEISLSKTVNIGKIRAFASKENYLFFGTEKGLFQYDAETGKLENILPNVSVFTLCLGTQNIIWVGTDMQGVWQIAPKKEYFSSFSVKKNNAFGKSAVRTFFEDENKNLWIGTKGQGIYIFENIRSENPMTYKNMNINNGLLNNSVYEIVEGYGNELWIGSDGKGINYYDRHQKKIFTLELSTELKKQFVISSVYSILPTSKEVLWVGTSGNGVYKLQIERSTQPYSVKNIEQFSFEQEQGKALSNNIVYSMVNDGNFLWVATRGGGLNRIDLQNQTVECFKHQPHLKGSISSNDVIVLYKDKAGFLWVGTSTGLNKLLRIEGKNAIFMHFSEKEGMPNNAIHGILEDEQGCIWASTNKGIVKLMPNKNGYKIISYDKKDGLQGDEFSDGAAYKSPHDNLFYFGGINGFSTFNPLKISENEYQPSLILDAFFIDNQENKLINFVKGNKYVFPHESKTLSFKFIPLDYLSGTKCEISYKIEGFQENWIHLGTSNTIVLSNLPSGNYVLTVRCSNADRIWSKQMLAFPFEIKTPWWNTLWMRIGYVALFLLLCWIIWKDVRHRIKVRNDIKMKILEKQKMEEIHQAKLRFFTNIAHEFSNSLTLIYGPCEQLLRNSVLNEKSKKYVNVIKSNSQRMHELIQQLINFRKAETGHLRIRIEKVDISELFRYVLDNFVEMLEHKKIKYYISFAPEHIYWQTDRSSVEKIIFNLISNAVKYTPENECVNIEVGIQNANLTFSVTNTGIGIDKEFQQHIFDRFEVLNRFEKQLSYGIELRNGIGLALCKSIVNTLNGTINVESDGKTFTTFSVNLPKSEVLPNLEVQEANQTNQESTQKPIIPPKITEQSLAKSNEKHNLKTILIVDDDKEIRELISDILVEKYEVNQASNGAEALELVQKEPPSLIICDVMMPVMNGIDFLKRMKSQELTRYVPIVFLSSKSSVESSIYGLEVGADAYVGKPFHPHYLQVLIQNILERKNELIHYGDSPSVAFDYFEGKKVKKEEKNLMLKITSVIHNHLDDNNLSVDFIANELAISRMQLYRKIKEISEQTPTEYIRQIRLKQAEKLLKTTSKTVSEIMYDCGFNSKTYFYREFSKKYTYTPKEYREIHQEN